MPIKTKEYSLFSPGRLVKAAADLHSASDMPPLIESGSVGIILEGPSQDTGAYFVQFVKNVNWWVTSGEIEPYLESS